MESSRLLDSVKRIHFVGIGGSRYVPPLRKFSSTGVFVITGSDTNESDTLERVRSYGIPVHMGHRAENIGDAQLGGVHCRREAGQPGLIAAREKGVPTVERSVLLAHGHRPYRDSIAVSGTHGKTTTTGMITSSSSAAGRDPSAVIGGKLPFIGLQRPGGQVGDHGLRGL